ncbi:hypothetical protein T4E_8010 [Trichinella pseudospiralis]|uniref:Uncharacterized protein n=1 Tax=Trichinella pseudospiralis TaxID=6337 RepID=A0A0V0XJF6_TRIPS|nr:hypothetical protein T4E_8010 [Trichinella pseudospiralis]
MDTTSHKDQTWGVLGRPVPSSEKLDWNTYRVEKIHTHEMSTGHAVCDGESGAADMFRANGIFPAENVWRCFIRSRVGNLAVTMKQSCIIPERPIATQNKEEET